MESMLFEVLCICLSSVSCILIIKNVRKDINRTMGSVCVNHRRFSFGGEKGKILSNIEEDL